MYTLSTSQEQKLDSCCGNIVKLVTTALAFRPICVAYGYRSDADQQRAYNMGLSKKLPGDSKHNLTPSQAIDMYPVIKNQPSFDKTQCYVFAGFIFGIAAMLNLYDRIRWGGAWDGNLNDVSQLSDLGHFEII